MTTFTRIPYTRQELERACEYITGFEGLPLLRHVVVAVSVGTREGRSPYSPAMRVVIQALNDSVGTHGQFRFNK